LTEVIYIKGTCFTFHNAFRADVNVLVEHSRWLASFLFQVTAKYEIQRKFYDHPN